LLVIESLFGGERFNRSRFASNTGSEQPLAVLASPKKRWKQI